MAQEINSSQEVKLLYQILKELEKLSRVMGKLITTTTTTTHT